MLSTCFQASIMSPRFDRIDWMPDCFRIMWPLSVAGWSGKDLEINSYVNPGNKRSCLFLIAFSSVDLGGKHKTWW